MKLHFIRLRYFSKVLYTIILWCTIILYSYVANAQKVFSPYPFQFDQVFYNLNTINPAANISDKKSFVQTGYNGFNALSNNLSSYYVNGRYAFGGDSSFKPHALGLFIINDKEGEYLNRAKLMAQYAVSISLSERTSWTTGASIGFVNNSLKPNAATGSESSFSADGDIGTWINHGKAYGGVSINQLFNNVVPFIDGRYVRKRHLSLVAGIEKNIGPFLTIRPELFIRTGPELYNKYALGITFVYKEHIIAGITGKTGNGLIPNLGIRNISLLKHKFGFLFSYRIPTSKYILTGTENAEIMLEYKF